MAKAVNVRENDISNLFYANKVHSSLMHRQHGDKNHQTPVTRCSLVAHWGRLVSGCGASPHIGVEAWRIDSVEPDIDCYDLILAGTETANCAIASRPLKNPGTRVLQQTSRGDHG